MAKKQRDPKLTRTEALAKGNVPNGTGVGVTLGLNKMRPAKDHKVKPIGERKFRELLGLK
jgi:hypothetical protein